MYTVIGLYFIYCTLLIIKCDSVENVNVIVSKGPVRFPFVSMNRVSEPWIENDRIVELKATSGENVNFTCRVANLGNKSVSWIRGKDLHILSSDLMLYTKDSRFSVFYVKNRREWILELKQVKVEDSGIYECQVNLNPKISLKIKLDVEESTAVIPGPKELYLYSGSDLALSCILNGLYDISEAVSWYHDGNVLFGSGRDSLILQTDSASRNSSVLIFNISGSDSGTYTCSYGNASPASVIVHVLSDENQAAVYQNICSMAVKMKLLLLVLQWMTLFLRSHFFL